MDLERRVVSSSFSSSSSPSSAATTDSAAEDDADRMEMEAAQALADLAQLAILREKKVTESTAEWGSKGKRVRKRVKSESPPVDLRLNHLDSEAPLLDLAEEKPVQERRESPENGGNLAVEAVKTEVATESHQPNQSFVSTCRATGGGRSRRNLTEAEKEERRIRRILANRESARQTIRRRQALCEELTRKATDLTTENARLKREKELAVKEYQSLETMNKHLKEQISKSQKQEVRIAREEPKSTPSDTPASHPFYFYNQQPFQLFCWPSVIQTSHPVKSQHEPTQNGFTIPPGTPAMVPSKCTQSQLQKNFVNGDGPETPLYIVPCPFFISNPDQMNGAQSQLSSEFKTTQDRITMNNHQARISSPKTVGEIDKSAHDLPWKIKQEHSSDSTETRSLCDLNESAAGFPSEGGQITGSNLKEHQGSAASAFIFKCEDAPEGVTTTSPGRSLTPLPEKKQEMVEYLSRTSLNTVAAAEARKRRKELTRLKNLHGRQCRMHV